MAGRVSWQLDRDPKKAVLRLFWYTEGRGTQDVGIVEELQLPTNQPYHEQEFQFKIPAEPYSFQGKLITLKWALELIVNKEVNRLDLLVSPWMKQPTLAAIPDEKKKGFSIS